MGKVRQGRSVEWVAEKMGVSPWTIRTWIRQGRLPHFKVGRRVIVVEDALEAMQEDAYRPATRS